MQLAKGTTVAVADGSKLSLFHNVDKDGGITLEAVQTELPESQNSGAGARHQNSAANPSDSQSEEDNFAAGVATMLNTRVESENIQHLVVIAAPRTLGELRKHYSKKLTSVLVTEVSKDLTGHTTSDIEKALKAA